MNDIEKYENDNNTITEEINIKMNQLLNNTNEIDNEIKEINNYIKNNQVNINKEISEYKKQISERYNNIKEYIKIYKNKFKNNIYEYNIFIDSIKNSIKNKYFKELINLENLFPSIDIDITNQNHFKNNRKSKKVIFGDLLSSRSFKELSVKNKKISNENSIISNNEIENNSFNLLNDDNDNIYENNSNYSNISLINYPALKCNELKEIRLIRNNIPNLSSIKNNNESNYNTKLSSSRIPYPFSKRNNYSFLDNLKIKINNKNQRNNKKILFSSCTSLDNLKQTKATNFSLNNSNISENPINYNTKYIFRNDNKELKKSKSCLSLQNEFSFNNIELFKLKKNKNNNSDINNENNYNCYFSNNKPKYISNYESFINDIFFNSSNPLLKKTFCYYREETHPSRKKFNPIKDNPLTLVNYPYNYIKSTISLCSNYDMIKIVPSSQLDNIIYSLKLICNTEISSMIKIIIEINKNFRRYKFMNKNWNKDEFILNQKNKYLIFEEDEIEKCCYNKYYNFFVILLNNKKIELLFSSYEEFKLWINGINFIIKNKIEIMKQIGNRKKYNI